MKKKYYDRKIYDKKYRNSHKKEIKTYMKNYYENHKEELSKKQKEYNYQHKNERNEYLNNKLKSNIKFKLSKNLRNRLYIATKNNYKLGSSIKDLGCSIPEFKLYLESKFQEGMTWKNWSKTGWHIDHITPLDSFNLQNREEFLKACHYTNLQPMWAEENLRKGGKVCRT